MRSVADPGFNTEDQIGFEPAGDALLTGRSSCPDTSPPSVCASTPEPYRRLRVSERASSPACVSPIASARLPELQPSQSALSPVSSLVRAGSGGAAGGPPLRTSGADTPVGASPRQAIACSSPGAELVVAVKRIDYAGNSRQQEGGGSRPRGPSKVRLSRMQAIEMLQLSRCKDCPFIVRLFGCVEDPRTSTPAPSDVPVSADCTMANAGRRQRRLSSPADAPPAPSSSSATSCRIVMEWAEGGDLGSFVQGLAARRGPCSDPARERLLMSEPSARYYLACLLEALGYLHGRNLLHRDVKPSNLLLTSDGRAKLGDLGMTCHMDKGGLAAGRAGTPNFMAPEVWAFGTSSKFSKGYGVTADLWSAGIVLHELLTGHLPESHPDEYLRPNWRFKPYYCGALFSPELRDLLGRLLAFKPRRRPQSCEEVRAHPWFAGFDWQGLRDGTLPAPYVPAAHRPQSAAMLALSGRLRQSWPSRAPSGGSGSAAGMMGGMPPVLEECGPPATSGGGAASGPGPSSSKGGGAGTSTSVGGSGPGYNSAAVLQPMQLSNMRSGQQAVGIGRYAASSLRGQSVSRASSGALCDEASAPLSPVPQHSWAPSWIRNFTSRAGAVAASFPGTAETPGPEDPLLCGGSSYDPGASPANSQLPSLSDRSLGSMTSSPGPCSARDARPAEVQPGATRTQLTPSRSRVSLSNGGVATFRSSHGNAASVALSGGALPPRYRPAPASVPQPLSCHTSESACATGRTASVAGSSVVGGSSSIECTGKGLWGSGGLPATQGTLQQHRAASVSTAGQGQGDRAVSISTTLHNAVAGFLLGCTPMSPATQRHRGSAAASTPNQSTLRESTDTYGGEAEIDAIRRASVTCASASTTPWYGLAKDPGAPRELRDSKGWCSKRGPMAAMDALLALPAQLQDAALVAAAAMGLAGRRPRIAPAPFRDIGSSAPASPGGLACGSSNHASNDSRAGGEAAAQDCGATVVVTLGADAGATPVADLLKRLSTDQTGSGVVVITRTSPSISSSSAAASPAKPMAAKQPAAAATSCSTGSAFAIASVEVAVAAAISESAGAVTPGPRSLHRPTSSFAFDPAATGTCSPPRQHQLALVSPTAPAPSPMGTASSGHSRMRSFSFDVAPLSLNGNSGSPGVLAGGPTMHSAEEGGAGGHHPVRHRPMGAIEEGEPSPASSSSPLMASPAVVQAQEAAQQCGELRRRTPGGALHRRPPWAAEGGAAAAAGTRGSPQWLQAAGLAVPVYALLVTLMLAACLVRGVAY
ncbi:hypothetical protein HYH02_013017 [Chlamydomonas schloesseri]|uniref:Protein kinase domain-containing protein n=1 Tax=Chlamydomonas schloesseri TaxID=2026947 RepID=A0A835SSB3_9CHLO|nr:hypothetical protein HYH02_013017 [Chlamydomonas schloesseri]|eukprot:KAG2432294.1 hypothetical protein HYH02_013017 [Chlamydomonas schloesseri]